MTKFYDANPPYIKADSDKVLFDGSSMTSLGGCVYSTDTDALDSWQEMSHEEAEAIVAAAEEEAAKTDYLAALRELGVDLNEEV